ncbi:hypothetical protein E2C01_000972 [Portunus trituberculatus]|uniref:Uncharacterized protein n=1 Tax=Portunus trituberculatus TaxID=210409 RepID=A0A5B7CJ15_PORTR|nr:hypothetical protein [Portunus trituberculatus]
MFPGTRTNPRLGATQTQVIFKVILLPVTGSRYTVIEQYDTFSSLFTWTMFSADSTPLLCRPATHRAFTCTRWEQRVSAMTSRTAPPCGEAYVTRGIDRDARCY